MRAGRRAAIVVPVCYLVAAVVVTWPLWADPASRAVAGNPNDADLFAWYMRYAATAISHGSLPALITSAQNAPQGVNMMWNTALLLPGVLLTPVTLLFGPQVSLTILTTAGFAGSAWAMFWVLRRWGVSAGAAALAGAVYGFSPALLHSAIGHYNLQLGVLLPLIVDAGLRLAVGSAAAPDDPADSRLAARKLAPVPDGAWLGLLVTAQLFISEELLLTAALAGLLLVVGLALGPLRMPARQIGQAARGLAVAIGVTLILAGWALWTQFIGPLSQHGSPFLPDFFENDLTGFVTPSGYLLFHTAASAAAAARYQGGAPEYLAYLGWPLIVVLVLATVTFWRHAVVRAMALTVIVLAVLSLGGHPLLSGTEHSGVNLPWHWIESLPLAGSALANRLSIVADGVAAALLAFCVDLARARFGADRRSAVLVLAVAVLACLPLLPRPLPVASAIPLPAGWSAVFRALRLPPGARVVVVPIPTANLTVAMRWQADTGHPASLIGGYFMGPAGNGQAYVGGNGTTATATYLDQLWVAGVTQGSPAAAAAAISGLPPLGAAPALSLVRADVAAWRPAALVADTVPGSTLGRYLVKLFGRPAVRSGDILAWRLQAKRSQPSAAAQRGRPGVARCCYPAQLPDRNSSPIAALTGTDKAR